MNVNLTCPYCGHSFPKSFNEVDTYTTLIAICDSDEGGCDNPFAYRVAVATYSTSFSLIEKSSGMDYPEYHKTIRSK